MNTENHYQETDLGNIAPNPKGEYSGSETYEYLDYVYYQGGSYLCLAELGTTITGVAPEPGKITEYWQAVALPGKQGEPGTPGENGTTPHIGDNGNWYIGENDTGVKTQGSDGITPHIGSNRHWWIGNSDTGVIASGTDGNDGKPGTTPHIGENNHWWIGEVDTGVDARGTKGDDGTTPHIGANGHWYIGETDTGVTAQGADGYTPQKGVDYFDGADGKSAYEYAQDGGYTGTEEEFAQKLATEYPTDVQINGTSIVEDGVAIIPTANLGRPGVIVPSYGLAVDASGNTKVNPCTTNIFLNGRNNINEVRPISPYYFDSILKSAMTDGIGAAWTDTEKTGAWERLTSIKTAMDEVAVAGARYFLGEVTELTITMPTDALVGQEIYVCFSSGDIPCSLYIDLENFDFVPGANKTSQIKFTYNGMDWLVESKEG